MQSAAYLHPSTKLIAEESKNGNAKRVVVGLNNRQFRFDAKQVGEDFAQHTDGHKSFPRTFDVLRERFLKANQ